MEKNTWKTVILLLSFSKWALWPKKEEETSMLKKKKTTQKFKERANHKMFIPENPR